MRDYRQSVEVDIPIKLKCQEKSPRMNDIQFKYEWDLFSLAHTTSVLTQSREATEKGSVRARMADK
jgi:hypothetical protein